MTRTIPLKIQNEYIVGDKVLIGAAGSHNDVVLQMDFSPMWEGLAKTVQFRDALEESTVEVVLTADLLEDGSTTTYLVPVPSGAKKYAGKMKLAVKGATAADGKETRATLAVYGEFTVKESQWDEDAETEQDVPATQAEQLQTQVEKILATIADARAAAKEAEESKDEAASSASAAEKYALISIGGTVAVHVDATTLVFVTKDQVKTYSGTYEVDAPIGDSLTLETENKLLVDNVDINPTPMAEISNPAGGKTLTIGG